MKNFYFFLCFFIIFLIGSNPSLARTVTDTARIQDVATEGGPVGSCRFLIFEFSFSCSVNESTVNVGGPFSPRHIRKAETMIGMTAANDRARLRQYFADKLSDPIDPVRIPWCAAWVNAVLADAGYATTNSLLARSFLKYGRAVKNPKKGDIVVLRRGRENWTGHVGFFIERVVINGTAYIAVLGGNQDRAVSVAFYPESRVLSYRSLVAAT